MKKKSIFAYIGLTTMVLGSLVSVPVSAEDKPLTNTTSEGVTSRVETKADSNNEINLIDTPTFNFQTAFEYPKAANGTGAYHATADVQNNGATNQGLRVINGGTDWSYKVTANISNINVNTPNNGSRNLDVNSIKFSNDNGKDSKGNGLITGNNDIEIYKQDGIVATGDKGGSSNGDLTTTNPKLDIKLNNLNGISTKSTYSGIINYTVTPNERPSA